MELPESTRSTDEVSTAHFIHQVRRDRDNDLHRGCMQYKSDFLLISIDNGFIEQEMYERILLSVNMWKTSYQPSTNDFVREAHELVSHTNH